MAQVPKKSDGDGNLTSLLPDDLARVAGKGLHAMEAFLDLMNEPKVDAQQYARARDFAKVGAVAVGASMKYLQAMNNRESLAMMRERRLKAA